MTAQTNPHPGSALGWQDLIDHMACGLVVFDAQDRVLICNREFCKLYGYENPTAMLGRSFEELLREVLSRGLLPQAAGTPETWVRDRLLAHRDPRAPLLRQMADGRWRRVFESRLPDGGLMAFSIDVTDEVNKSEALDHAGLSARVANQRLEDAIEALPAGFELWDASDNLVLTNAEFRRMHPQVAELMFRGVGWEALVRANHAAGGLVMEAAALDEYLAARRAARGAPGVPATHTAPDGRWVRTVEHGTRDGGVVGISVDITELMGQRARADSARLEAEAATQRLNDAIEALPDGFALYDANDRLVAFNERYRLLYGHSASLIVPGVRFEDILRHGVERGQYPQAYGQEEAWIAERLALHLNPVGPVLQELPGNRWLRIDERRTRDGGVAGVRTEVTELVRREQDLSRLNAKLDESNLRLELLSETDVLTAVANRRQFDRRLGEEWSRVVRHGVPLTLMLIDVDHFKLYNDHHGHPAGDACLARIAATLVGCARRPADLVARYGGEEFAVLLPHTDDAGAEVQAQRCLAAIDQLALPHGHSPTAAHVTLSIGLAVAQAGDSGPADALVRRADGALYRAKQMGRRRIEIG